MFSSSIEYWFRCMDLDGDGVLSMYELEFFYEEQCQKLEAMAIEPLPFEDCLCQMFDLVKPEVEGPTCSACIHLVSCLFGFLFVLYHRGSCDISGQITAK